MNRLNRIRCMQISHPLSSDWAPPLPERLNVRATAAVIVVVGIHAALLAMVWSSRDEAVSPPASARTITAELLAPAPAISSAVVQRPAPTLKPPASPADMAKPKVPPQHVTGTKHATPPLPETRAPSTHRLSVSDPAETASPAPAPSTATVPTPVPTAVAPAAAASSPAADSPRPTIGLAAPQDISHLNCSIAQPPYPAHSQRRGETGSVTVKFIVGLTGQLESVELKSSSGYSRLDEAALAAVRDSTCRPYIENGAPRRVPTSVPFVFALND